MRGKSRERVKGTSSSINYGRKGGEGPILTISKKLARTAAREKEPAAIGRGKTTLFRMGKGVKTRP